MGEARIQAASGNSAHAVHVTTAARTLRVISAKLATVQFANTKAVTGIVTSAHSVVGERRYIVARPKTSGESTRLTIRATRCITAISIDTIAAQALAGNHARSAIDAFTNAIAVALIGADAQVRRNVVGRTAGKIAARTHTAHDVARFACSIASAVATHSVNAEVTQASTIGATCNANFVIAIVGRIARLRRTRAGSVVLPFGHSRTRSETPSDVARFAQNCARVVTANSVHASCAHAFVASGTRYPIGFLAIACAVTRIVHPHAAR